MRNIGYTAQSKGDRAWKRAAEIKSKMIEPRTVNILGTRGIPAAHGGFETFAQELALYLVARGWAVNVFCQVEVPKFAKARPVQREQWNGVTLVKVPIVGNGSISTILFDAKSTYEAAQEDGVDLVLGYNTAFLTLYLRCRRRRVIINMDGIEWKRSKWSRPAKLWFRANEWIARFAATVAIADHPEIAQHLKRQHFKNVVTIPYGSNRVISAEPAFLTKHNLDQDEYMILIARLEPENSIYEIVKAFVASGNNGKLVILGKIDDDLEYHKLVRSASDESVVFLGPIYNREEVSSLRYFARCYLHGHQVGGTNPSLVEALGAGNMVIAHDNHFNRWTAGRGQLYFSSVEECTSHITSAFSDEHLVLSAKKEASIRHHQLFEWAGVLSSYENLLAGI